MACRTRSANGVETRTPAATVGQSGHAMPADRRAARVDADVADLAALTVAVAAAGSACRPRHRGRRLRRPCPRRRRLLRFRRNRSRRLGRLHRPPPLHRLRLHRRFRPHRLTLCSRRRQPHPSRHWTRPKNCIRPRAEQSNPRESRSDARWSSLDVACDVGSRAELARRVSRHARLAKRKRGIETRVAVGAHRRARREHRGLTHAAEAGRACAARLSAVGYERRALALQTGHAGLVGESQA